MWAGAVLLPLIFLIIFFAYPVIGMLRTGLSGTSISDIIDTATSNRNLRVLWQTIFQAGMGTALSVLLGVPGAYVLYRLRFPFQRVLRAIATIPFVLPTVVVGVAFRALLGPQGPLHVLGLDKTITAVILALAFFNFSVVVRTVGTMWNSLDPASPLAARTLGASRFTAFRTVTLPQLGPAIASAAAIVFLYCATSYGLVRTLGSPGYGTLETEIWVRATAYVDMQTAAILSVVQILIIALALLVSQVLVRSTQASLKLRRHQVPVTRSDVPVMSGVFVVMAVLIVAPLATLLVRSFHTRQGWSLENYRLLSTPGHGFAGGVDVLTAIGNSLRIATFAACLALMIGLLLALVLTRPVGGKLAHLQSLTGAAVLLPLGVSAVTVGFGFFVTLDSPPLDLRTSPLLIPIAQAVVAVPLVVRSLTPILGAIHPSQRDAAATLGASPWRVLFTVDGPYVVRGFGIAAGFAFATSLGEFGATSFLARPDTQTLPVVIVRLLGRPGENNYGMALAGAVILAVVTASIMALAEAARRDHD